MSASPYTRSCDGCTACCKTHRIFELNKPAGQWCPHCMAQGGGCSIYDQRPQGCRDFVCQWMRGYGDQSDRPDRSNIVVDYCDIGLPEVIFILWEAEHGAIKQPFAEDTINHFLAQDFFVGIMHLSGEKGIIVPPSKALSDEEIRELCKAG